MITQEFSFKLSNGLLDVVYADREFAKRLKTYRTFDVTSKDDLFKLFNDLIGAVDRLSQVGVVNVNSRLTAAFGLVQAAMTIMKPLFGITGGSNGADGAERGLLALDPRKGQCPLTRALVCPLRGQTKNISLCFFGAVKQAPWFDSTA